MAVRRMKLQILVMTLLTFLSITWLGGVWWFSGNPIVTARANERARAALQAAVAIPATFSYQGILRAADGTLVNGTVDITLSLYNVVTGGTALHSETFTSVNVRDGAFGVVVGDTTPIGPTVFDNATLYIGITVNSDAEMLPRQRLHPVPWAMQASTAQTAVAAQELVEGGGVPGIVSFGTGGVSEIAFAPNGGKITNSATGMAITGGTNKTVTTDGALSVNGALSVGGDLTVAGNWSAGAILDKGDSNGGANQRSNYLVSLNRYVVEAPDNGTAPDSVAVDDTILTTLCQDEDGCIVRVGMRNWEGLSVNPGDMAVVGPVSFALGNAKADGTRRWTLGSGTHGTDNNGVIEHVINVHNACFFTDAKYINAVASEGEVGFGLLNWHGQHDNLEMVCILIIED